MCQLLAAGVSVNVLDSSETRNTPLHWAATYGNKDVIQCLCSQYDVCAFIMTPRIMKIFCSNISLLINEWLETFFMYFSSFYSFETELYVHVLLHNIVMRQTLYGVYPVFQSAMQM